MSIGPAMTFTFDPANMAEATARRRVPSRSDGDGAGGARSLWSSRLNNRLAQDSVQSLRFTEKAVRLSDVHLLVIATIDLQRRLV